LAVEKGRRAAEQAAAENAKILAARLQAIETALAGQRARELEAMQSANRVMLIVAGCFAGVGMIAMLLMAYFQWRAAGKLAELAAFPARTVSTGSPYLTWPEGAESLPAGVTVSQANSQLAGALDRLEQKIYQLESATRATLKPRTIVLSEVNDHGIGNGNSAAGEPADLLVKGQKLLDADKPEEALACFEQVLSRETSNPDALVKKGAALERLNRFPEALECYNSAIAANKTFTIAYLAKGGLFNRMERFNEALECYEEALRTQEKET
jgi:tetratricopeptide (TPR) repeat protein